jgi:hypothetical protein
MKDGGERVIWKPTAFQSAFLSAPEREVLAGGSAGCGKTDCLLVAALSQTGNAKHRALILRKGFPQMRDLIARSHEFFIPLGAMFNEQKSAWTFRGGAKIEFGFLDSPEDRFRYLGRQFSFIGFDELCEWGADGVDANGEPVASSYVYLLSRLRAARDSGLRLEVRATCVPAGAGKSWVQQRFGISDEGGASMRVDHATGYHRRFIPGRISDNPHLAGGEYERQLQALPDAQRKALLLGRWDTMEGAIFSEFNFNVHICDPFNIPREWRRWRSCDDGFANPAAVLWLAHDRDINDVVYVTQELYRSGLTPEALAQNILIMDGGHNLRGVIDSAAFADSGMGARGDVMNKLGCRWQPVDKYPGSRLAGLSAIHSRLALRDGGRSTGLRIFRDRCPNLVRELTSLVYSTTRPEEIAAGCSDHAVDALRYALLYRPIEGRRVRLGGI